MSTAVTVCIVAVLALSGATSALHLPLPGLAFQDSSGAKEATAHTRRTQSWNLRNAVVYKQTSLQEALQLQHPGVAVLVVGTHAPQRQVRHINDKRKFSCGYCKRLNTIKGTTSHPAFAQHTLCAGCHQMHPCSASPSKQHSRCLSLCSSCWCSACSSSGQAAGLDCSWMYYQPGSRVAQQVRLWPLTKAGSPTIADAQAAASPV
jgi:hypothetical protein